MKKMIALCFGLMVLVVSAVIFGEFYSYIFAKDIQGEVLSVERAGPSTVVTTDRSLAFSFAVAIKIKSGEIFTASSEDRQWAVAKAGLCVDAKLYPYPPWNIEKAGTYANARLIKLSEKCQ